MLSYYAAYDQKRGWRVIIDRSAYDADPLDMCGAVNECAARETARLMTELEKAKVN